MTADAPGVLTPEQRRVLCAVFVTGAFLFVMKAAVGVAAGLGLYGPFEADQPIPLNRRAEGDTVAFAFAGLVVAGFAAMVPPDASLRPRRTGLALAAYAAFLAPWFVVGVAVYTWLLGRFGETLPVQHLLQYWRGEPYHAWGPWVVAIVTCLVGPLAEELVFRGYVQGALRPFLGANGAIAGSALVFGYAHGWQYLFPIGLLGVLFGWLRERTGGLWAPFVAHAVHNGLTLVTAVTWPELIDWIYRKPA